MMYDHGKSDRCIVPMKSSNNGKRKGTRNQGRPYLGTQREISETDMGQGPTVDRRTDRRPAEKVEGRHLTKGNSRKQNMHRTQCRERMQSALGRIRQAAIADREMQFTSLYHHIYSLDTLTTAFYGLNRRSTPGVDRVTWQEYEQSLTENLEGLSDRLKRGGYRAKPVRRTYIPKADGSERSLGIPVLEDKIVQAATKEVLNAIYEQEFLGFSYGFRPGRSPHDALDAVSVGIERRKVNWVPDADIMGFFDAIDHECLVKLLRHRILDQRVERLVRKWLKSVLNGHYR
jgi:RNA-directed DNA polymerase